MPSGDERNSELAIGGPVSSGLESEQVLPEELSNTKLAMIFGIIWIGLFFAAVDTTVVATLLVPISTTFRSLSSLAWLGATFLIGTAASQPLCGRLTDIFGRVSGLVVSNIVFGIGTLICGLATAQWQLLLGRAIAGIGGGALYAIVTFVGSDLVPLRKRGLVTGISNLLWGVGTGIGGLYGGWINDFLGWKWAFLIQVPLIAVSALLSFFVVKIPRRQLQQSNLARVDYLGCFTLVAALILLLVGLDAGGIIVSWNSPLVYSTIPTSLTLLLVFIYVEKKAAKEPIIPLNLLRNQTVLAASLTWFFDHVSSFGVLFYTPVYLQLIGYNTTKTGEVFLPNSAGTAIGAISAGIVMRATGTYWWLSVMVHIFSVIGCGLLLLVGLSTPEWYPFVFLGLSGVGFGGMLVINLTALVSSMSRKEHALGTSLSFVFRSVGSTLGVTLSSAIFQNVLKSSLWSQIGGLEDAANIIASVRANFSEVAKLDSQTQSYVLRSYMQALTAVFTMTFSASILAAVSALFLREHKLHNNLARS